MKVMCALYMVVRRHQTCCIKSLPCVHILSCIDLPAVELLICV